MLKTSTRWLFRVVITVLVVGWLLFAGAAMGLRYWVLPHIGDYREAIALSISKSAGQKVTIGEIDAGWHGLRPYLLLRDLTVHDRPAQRRALGNPELIVQRPPIPAPSDVPENASPPSISAAAVNWRNRRRASDLRAV